MVTANSNFFLSSSTTNSHSSMTPANTNLANHNPSPHSNGYLVYTGKDEDGLIQLYIYSFGITVSDHLCNTYFPNQQSGKLMRDYNAPSPPYVLEEHGWFKDPNIFDKICKIQRFPNHPTQNETFKEWRSAVLSTIKKDYEDLWIPNNGWV